MGRRTSKKGEELKMTEGDVFLNSTPSLHGYCAACEKKLHDSLPKDFPDRFKLCCSCHFIALFLSGQGDNYKSHKEIVIHFDACGTCKILLEKYGEKITKLLTVK